MDGHSTIQQRRAAKLCIKIAHRLTVRHLKREIASLKLCALPRRKSRDFSWAGLGGLRPPLSFGYHTQELVQMQYAYQIEALESAEQARIDREYSCADDPYYPPAYP